MYLKMLLCFSIIILLIPEFEFATHKPVNIKTSTETVSTSNTTITPEDFRFCPLTPKTCRKAKSFEKTKHLICYTSEDCGSDFACCPDACYKHKICKNVTKDQSSSTSEFASTEAPLSELINKLVITIINNKSKESEETGRHTIKKLLAKILKHKEFQETVKPTMLEKTAKTHTHEESKESEKNTRKEKTAKTNKPKESEEVDEIERHAIKNLLAKILKEFEDTDKPTTEGKPAKTHKPEESKRSEKNTTIKEEAVETNPAEKSKDIEKHTIKKLLAKTEKPTTNKKLGTFESPTIGQGPEKTGKPEESEDSIWIKGFLSTTNKPNGDSQSDKCPPENILCSFPLIDRENDANFNCDKNKCPVNFICCKDNCFKHKICKELASSNENVTLK